MQRKLRCERLALDIYECSLSRRLRLARNLLGCRRSVSIAGERMYPFSVRHVCLGLEVRYVGKGVGILVSRVLYACKQDTRERDLEGLTLIGV